MTKYLITIVGPTAIGKTALSIKIAQHFKTEIISADSRQFFKEMTIGTAVPSLTELTTIKHHFIHHISIENNYNVGTFEKDAIALLDGLFKIHDVVIMVGGSGLYLDAITKGLDKFPKIDSKIRENLNQRLKKEGLESLQKQLKELDRSTYQTIAIDNPHRVIRALEICIGTGKPYSSFLNKNKTTRDFTSITIGLTAERQTIYNRINKRVDMMMEQGLLDEVKSLQNKQDLNALKTVGYKELFNYLNGEWTLDFAVSEIKKNTRRYAKRQLTWFKKIESIIWFDTKAEVDKVIQCIFKNIK
jgi:tRNA dimethylallyltransferase